MRGLTGRELAGGVLATVGFFLVSTLFPVLGIVVSLLAPLPILYFRIKRGRSSAVIIGLVSSLIILAGLGRVFSGQGFLFFFQLLLTGLITGEIWEKDWSIEKTIVWSVGLAIASSLLLLVLYASLRGVSPLEMLRADLQQNMKHSLELYRSMGMPLEGGKDLNKLAQQMASLTLRILPALSVMGFALVVWANLMLCRGLLQARDTGITRWADLKNWQAPERLVWPLVASGFAVMIPWGTLKVAAVNALLVLVLVYFFQGLAIVAFYLDKKKVPLLLRVLLYVLIWVQQFITIMVAALGLFDTWFDFRRLRKSSP